MTTSKAERLNGSIERRSIELEVDDFELRAEGDTLKFEGYASLFGQGYEMYGGPEKGGWTEYVDKRAFERTLSTKPDVVLNLNHGASGTGLPLARTTSGTLELRTDKKGLRPSATLDLRDPDVQALQVKVGRGDVNQMSFAFRTIRQEWDEDETKRTLLEVSLDRGDVSIVTNGANPKTSVQLRSMIEALARMDPERAAEEIRGLEDDVLAQIEAARKLLAMIPAININESKGGLSLAKAKRIAMLDAA